MACDFNATTSKIEHTTAEHSITSLVTLSAFIFADGQGEGGFGGIIELSETGTSIFLGHNNSAGTLLFASDWTTTNGNWTFPATDSAWHYVSVSYDGGSTANNPIGRVDGANVTMTETQTPAGSFVNSPTGYAVGNNTGQTETWDGMIAHAQLANVIWTAGEMDQSRRRPGSVRRGLRVWLPLYNATYLSDLSGNAFNGTATSVTNRTGGPPCSNLFSGAHPPKPFGGIGWNMPPRLVRPPNVSVRASGMIPPNRV